ncbi:MAG: branched-chain amino acid ABC transporter permease [Dehalococcoidia bacterium]|nr:MAG: branched-chain amino acid ABC transporter permease [Dehalococcoidia bacterium]
MTSEAQLVVIGIIVGSILALGAIGLTLIYGIMKFANFAHGDTMMLGAYVAFFVLTGTVARTAREDTELPWSIGSLPGALEPIGKLTFGYGLIIGTLVAAVVIALFLVALNHLVYRPLRKRGSSIVVFAVTSLGLAMVTRALMLIIWGPDPRVYVSGIHIADKYDLGFTTITLKADQIFMFAVAIVLTVLVYFLLFRTKLGKAMRAVTDNPDLARVSGIDTEQVFTWTWVIGGALVAVAGVLLALQTQLNPILGFVLLLPLFASTILGGIGSPQGALAGAMIIGISQEVSVGIDLSIGGLEILPLAPAYKFSVAVVIMIFTLLVRPQGLFGAKA